MKSNVIDVRDFGAIPDTHPGICAGEFTGGVFRFTGNVIMAKAGLWSKEDGYFDAGGKEFQKISEGAFEARLMEESPSRYIFDVRKDGEPICTYTVMTTSLHSPELLESAQKEAMSATVSNFSKENNSWLFK